MERTMIKLKSGVYYKVPEDMFPFAAQNLVNHGMAEWVERHELTFGEKVASAVTAAKQNLPLKPRTKPDEVELAQRKAERAVLKDLRGTSVNRPRPPIIDTDRDGEATIV